jgi:hypothetical protein
MQSIVPQLLLDKSKKIITPEEVETFLPNSLVERGAGPKEPQVRNEFEVLPNSLLDPTMRGAREPQVRNEFEVLTNSLLDPNMRCAREPQVRNQFEVLPNSLLDPTTQVPKPKQSKHFDLFMPNSLLQQQPQSVKAHTGPLLSNVDPKEGKPKLEDGLLGQVNRREKEKMFKNNPESYLIDLAMSARERERMHERGEIHHIDLCEQLLTMLHETNLPKEMEVYVGQTLVGLMNQIAYTQFSQANPMLSMMPIDQRMKPKSITTSSAKKSSSRKTGTSTSGRDTTTSSSCESSSSATKSTASGSESDKSEASGTDDEEESKESGSTSGESEDDEDIPLKVLQSGSESLNGSVSATTDEVNQDDEPLVKRAIGGARAVAHHPLQAAVYSGNLQQRPVAYPQGQQYGARNLQNTGPRVAYQSMMTDFRPPLQPQLRRGSYTDPALSVYHSTASGAGKSSAVGSISDRSSFRPESSPPGSRAVSGAGSSSVGSPQYRPPIQSAFSPSAIRSSYQPAKSSPKSKRVADPDSSEGSVSEESD